MLIELTERITTHGGRKFAFRAEDVVLVRPLDDGGVLVQLDYGTPPWQFQCVEAYAVAVKSINDALAVYLTEEE
ncbi:MAG: hypothetical protein IT518_14600 [Burkholderiales bacterium]|nr:hypothetical protein [Burkholderiales bacterium]